MAKKRSKQSQGTSKQKPRSTRNSTKKKASSSTTYSTAKSIQSLVSFKGIFLSLIVIFFAWRQQRVDLSTEFYKWFIAQGGFFSHKIYGPRRFAEGYGLGRMEFEVRQGDQLLLIPAHIIITADKTLSALSQLSLSKQVSDNLQKNHVEGLDRQDVLIAMRLLYECSQGKEASMYTYMALLPKETPPRLDTFNEEELDLLGEDDLAQLARTSRTRLESVWQESVQAAMKDWVATTSHSPDATQCLTFDNFHRFAAIASSHAMILDDTKYLAPMADFINHASRPEEDYAGNKDITTFKNFHRYDKETGNIVVFSDRRVSRSRQIFEEYGKVDNTLYLTQFGFIPPDNPYHCAQIRPKYMPPLSAELIPIMEKLNAQPEPACVRRDGTFLDDVLYWKLASLAPDSPQLNECLRAAQTEDRELILAACMHHSGASNPILRQLIRDGANATLNAFDTTIQEDLDLFYECVTDPTQREQRKLALVFRLEEKKLLHHLVKLP